MNEHDCHRFDKNFSAIAMNAQQKPTLNDYLDNARNDAPVVSFEESSRRLREAERRKKRRGVWWWFSGFAMPLRYAVSHALSQMVGIVASRPFMGGSLAGAAAMLLMVWLWQRGVVGVMPDENSRPTKQQSGSQVLQNTQSTQNSQNSHERASARAVGTSSSAFSSAQSSASSSASARVSSLASLLASSPNNYARLLASTTTTPEAKSLAERAGSSPISHAALPSSSLATEFSHSSTSALPNAAAEPMKQESVPHKSVPDESVPQDLGTPTASKKARSVVFRSDAPMNASLAADSGHATGTPLVPPLLSEPSRFSIEFRLAARANSDTLAGNGTALQNASFGVFYRLSEHHSIGIEGGTQPLALSVRSFAQSATAISNDMNRMNQQQGGTGATNQQMPQPPPQPTPGMVMGIGIQTSRADTMPPVAPAANPSLSTVERTTAPWFAAAYQYNHDVVRLGGVAVQPLARISLGGGGAGAVGRVLAGISLFPEERFTVLLAAEGAALGAVATSSQTPTSQPNTPNLPNQQSSPQQAFTISSQTGVTLGIVVKF
jgi:hypothetical protein